MILGSLKRKWGRVQCNYLRMLAGINTPFEFLLGFIDQIMGLVGINEVLKLAGIKQTLMDLVVTKRRKKMYTKDGCYVLKDIKIPLLKGRDEALFLSGVLEETLGSYLFLGDTYDVSDVESLKLTLEDFYIYSDKTREIDFKLKQNDVVIDAGAWIGDFSAYASACGAYVYAFEPVSNTYEILVETSRLNKNIVPINMGLGAQKESHTMIVNECNTGSASISLPRRGRSVEVHITTLDDFVDENKLERVDFIKADIEGHERFMLLGAKKTLKNFGPRLAICTYHLPDDPQVLKNIIKEANPAYEVIQRRKKLFAYIP